MLLVLVSLIVAGQQRHNPLLIELLELVELWVLPWYARERVLLYPAYMRHILVVGLMLGPSVGDLLLSSCPFSCTRDDLDDNATT